MLVKHVHLYHQFLCSPSYPIPTSSSRSAPGGEKLKAKADKLAAAERKNREAPAGVGGLNDPNAWN